jgi:hypothetical protein
MTTDRSEITDALVFAMERGREMISHGGGFGYGVAELFDGDGRLVLIRPFWNTILDKGDEYHATRVIAAVSPSNTADITKMTGMQIGSNSTAVNKGAGTGIAMGTLLAGQAFDASYPQTANLGTNLGWNAIYKTTYAAGTGTSATVQEATLTNGTIGSGSTSSNTQARTVFTAINKGALDTLAITWNTKFLGT